MTSEREQNPWIDKCAVHPDRNAEVKIFQSIRHCHRAKIPQLYDLARAKDVDVLYRASAISRLTKIDKTNNLRRFLVKFTGPESVGDDPAVVREAFLWLYAIEPDEQSHGNIFDTALRNRIRRYPTKRISFLAGLGGKRA